MKNVIIIEDEMPSARLLKRMLEKQGVEVKKVLSSVKESILWLENHPYPDLIFLDIQLGDGLSFEIFEQVKVNSSIIFTTAYDEYALKAFKLNSIDYLLKPIVEEELSVAINKYKNLKLVDYSIKLNLEDIQKLFNKPAKQVYKKRFISKIGQHIKRLEVEEVVCFFSENKGTYAQSIDGRSYLLDTTLEQLEKELAPDTFFRVNRKYIVHIQSIKDIIAYTNSRLELKLTKYESEQIIVARDRVKEFREWLE